MQYHIVITSFNRRFIMNRKRVKWCMVVLSGLIGGQTFANSWQVVGAAGVASVVGGIAGIGFYKHLRETHKLRHAAKCLMLEALGSASDYINSREDVLHRFFLIKGTHDEELMNRAFAAMILRNSPLSKNGEPDFVGTQAILDFRKKAVEIDSQLHSEQKIHEGKEEEKKKTGAFGLMHDDIVQEFANGQPGSDHPLSKPDAVDAVSLSGL